MAVTLGLIGWRGDRLRAPGRIDSPVSREGAFLANNVLFAAFAFVVLLGTVFPLMVEALNGDQLSVGAPYFDRMTMPHRPGAAVPHGRGPGAAVAQGVGRAAVPAPVLARLGRHRRGGGRRGARRPGLAPLVAFGLAGSPPAPPSARWCWPPAARAGGASWGGPTAA